MRLIAVGFATLTLSVVACVGDNPGSDNPDAGASGTAASSSSGASGNTSSSGGSSSSSGDAGASGSSSGGPAPTCGVPGKPESNLCSCPVGTTACGDSCVDLQTDETNCGRCDRDCGTGSCTAGQCSAVTIVPGQRNVNAIVPHGDRYFWVRSPSGGTGGGFYSAKRDGSDLKTLHDGDATSACYSLAVFQDTAYALCKDPAPAGTRILTCTLPDCTDVVYRAAPATGRIVVDPDSSRLFYADSTTYNQPPDGRIYEYTAANASLAIGNANQANPGPPVLAGGFVYWLNGGTYTSDSPLANSGVFRAALATPGTQATVADTNGLYFDCGGLTNDGVNLYWIGRNNFVSRTDVLFAPLAAGGGSTVFAQGQNTSDVFSDGTNVFFDDSTSKEIRYCPRLAGCGGGVTSFVPNEENVGILAGDGDGLLWTKFTGEIRRIAKP